jgi:hypothetical protein
MTQIADAPRYQLLHERHDHEIELDISDQMFMILGSACHSILEAAGEANVITEQRITVPILGKEISMKADRIEPIEDTDPLEHWLKDYKITRVWAYKYGAKPTQIAQANGYRYGYNTIMRLNITRLTLEMFLRDWTDTEALHHDYPDAEVMPLDLPVWPMEKIQAYLEERTRIFMDAEHKDDNQLPLCSAQERWSKPDTYAYQKKGAKRATRVFKTRAEAQEMLNKKKPADRDKYEVKFRPGENVRCERFCHCKKWCNQYAAMQNSEEDDF